MSDHKKMRLAACCAAGMLAGLGHAQMAPDDLAPGQWRISAEQARFSALLDGDILRDEHSPVRHQIDAVDSWARSEWRLAWRPSTERWDFELATFVETQAHMSGTGGRVAAHLNNRLADGSDARYPFDLESVKYRRWGVSVQHAGRTVSGGWWPNRWTLAGNLFAVDRYKSIGARGLLVDRADAGLALQAKVTENQLGRSSSFIRPETALGWGLTMDASALWGNTESRHVSLTVRDLGPSIRLRQLLGTDRTIDTDTVSFDEDGYMQLAPVVNGAYSNREARIRIKPEGRVEAGWRPRAGQQWLGRLIHHGSRQEAALHFQQTFNDLRLNVGAHAMAEMPSSVSFGLAAPTWGVGFRGDRLNPRKARIWGLSGHLLF